MRACVDAHTASLAVACIADAAAGVPDDDMRWKPPRCDGDSSATLMLSAQSAGDLPSFMMRRTAQRMYPGNWLPQFVDTKPGAACVKEMPGFSRLRASSWRAQRHASDNDAVT
jgi:hypothetical protein